MNKILQKKHTKEAIMTFKEFRILALKFSLNENFKSSSAPFEHDVQTEIGFNLNKEEKLLRSLMRVSLSGNNAPFSLEISCAGLFLFNKELPDKAILERTARINCPAIIFPYVREAISDITRRAGFPTVYLPLVNFAKLYVESEAQKKQKTKKESGQ